MSNESGVDASQGEVRAPVPIVGVGASAGGIEAIEGLLKHLPATTGVALIVILHLDPKYPSLAHRILDRAGDVPVEEAADGTRVEANHVYVLPPNAVPILDRGVIRLSTPAVPRHASIDAFFRSLAADAGDAAIGVVLSGTGGDGAAGLRAIKERGGMTMAQAPDQARYDGMPRSAIAAGAVDWVLPVAEIPQKLVAHAHRIALGRRGEGPTLRPSAEVTQHFRTICSTVLHRTGHDFSWYKQATMLRRIQRRMSLVQAESLAGYVQILKDQPGEADLLFADLLIGVTRFFRDPAVFEAIGEKVIPQILEGRGGGSEVRLWVPGCATGEEAYSLAILVREGMAKLDSVPEVKIFATDIDDQALEGARLGRYPDKAVENVSLERLGRFFLKQGSTYQVSKEIRDLCIFSSHNLVSDPPFSRLDLISCRNLLIYLEADIQKQLVPLFHYALASGGYLLLGPSENLAGYPELFRMVDKDTRIFQRKDTHVTPTAIFPLVGSKRVERAMADPVSVRGDGRRQAGARAFERLLLEEYAPPSVIVNELGTIVYVSGKTGDFLELPSGITRVNVVEMAHPAIRPTLHTALHRAVRDRRSLVEEDLTVEMEGMLRRLQLVVRAFGAGDGEQSLYMIVFRDTTPPVAKAESARGDGAAAPSSEQLTAELERELLSTRAHLQTTIEELESANEELQSANEEMLSTNEELQSANEELQTSKEELQSINEELQTVNVELVRKVEELDRANDDLQNLFASSHIPTLFLDGELRIKKFSPTAKELFRVIESDLGRHITDVVHTFTDGDLVSDVRGVLATLDPKEQEVHQPEGDRWFIQRVRPYRSLENLIDGVVVTFVDITDLKRAQERVATLAAIVESSNDAIIGHALDGTITSWNAGAERMMGFAAAQVVGTPLGRLCPAEGLPQLEAALARVQKGEHVEISEGLCLHRDGRSVDVVLGMSPLRDAAGAVVAAASIAHDLTGLRRTERALRRSEERFRQLNESGALGIAFFDRSGKIIDANDSLLALLGQGRDELAGGRAHLGRLAPPGPTDGVSAFLDEIWGAGHAPPREVEHVRRDGEHVVVLLGGARLEGGEEGVAFALDVTTRRRAEDALRRSEERLRLALDATTLGTWELDPVTGRMSWSDRAKALWGLPPDAEVTYEAFVAGVHPDDRRRADEGVRQALDPNGSGELAMEYRVVVPGGDSAVRWIGARGRTSFADGGGFRRPARLIGTLLDITERRETEEALREADRRKDQFFAVLGHELRNPLAPIRNAVHVMRKVGFNEPGMERARDIIDRQVAHMTRLLDDLLDIARLSSGKVSLRTARLDLCDLVRATVEERRAEIVAAGLSLDVSLPARPLWVEGDATRLAQSVSNLVVNAVKFTPPGGRVSVSLEGEGGRAVLRVRDTGTGIEPEMMKRLFEPFSQADRSIDRSRGGLGLGLHLVRGFVEMHGGEVRAASEGAGKGAELTVILPLAEAPVPAPMPSSPDLTRQRVLVIEDHVDSAETMVMFLEIAGHEAAVAHDGPEGIERAHAFRPEVILCDIGLPGGMDGYDVAHAVRADPELAGVRLIALTGYGQEEDKARAREAGFDAHMTKPIDPQVLERLLARPA
jgi:two-component system CheB/CheR fusion protein